MGSILPYIRTDGAVFDDEATKIMGQAFDEAREELHDAGQPTLAYVIAKRIIDAAKNGERDVARLRAAGLAALGLGEKEAG